MISNKSLKLKVLKTILNCPVRHYTNRDVLKLHERGLFQDVFPETAIGVKQARDLLRSKPQCVYAGFDPTANSLHLGNLLVLMGLLHWQRAGHKVIALIGGATGKIGDPSGRTSERPEILESDVAENCKEIGRNMLDIFQNHEVLWNAKNPTHKLAPLIILNNEDWYKSMNPMYLIGSIGRYFRMGTMLSRTSVQSRLKSDAGMSFTEFSYQIFQSYDWLHLLKTHGCRFQIGGSDQMGNFMSGHDLISRIADVPVYGLTLPLLLTEHGDKFGKSAGNALWLSASKTSSFSLYQYFIRTKDSDVRRLLQLFTFIPLDEIDGIVEEHSKQPEKRNAQKRLAEDVITLVHGASGLEQAQVASAALYDGDIKSLGQLSAEDISAVFHGATIKEILPTPGLTVYELAQKVKCFMTDADAERIIAAGGFYINQCRTQNSSEVVGPQHILPNRVTLLRVGKRTYHIVKWLI